MAFVGSLLFTNCKTPRMVSSNKLIGTSWQMTDRVIGLDSAPTITFNYTLNFIDANKAQLIEHEEYSGVSGTYVKNDGSVDYTPGHFEDKKKVMLYVAFFSRCYWMTGAVFGGVAGYLIPFSMEGIDFCMTALFVIIFIDQWECHNYTV